MSRCNWDEYVVLLLCPIACSTHSGWDLGSISTASSKSTSSSAHMSLDPVNDGPFAFCVPFPMFLSLIFTGPIDARVKLGWVIDCAHGCSTSADDRNKFAKVRIDDPSNSIVAISLDKTREAYRGYDDSVTLKTLCVGQSKVAFISSFVIMSREESASCQIRFRLGQTYHKSSLQHAASQFSPFRMFSCMRYLLYSDHRSTVANLSRSGCPVTVSLPSS